MTVLFLDIDGVLNGHDDPGHFGICRNRAQLLSKILHAVPECAIVISSSWRHMIIDGSMTLIDFEQMLFESGVDCLQRVAGHIGPDDPWSETNYQGLRAKQIESYIKENFIERYVVLDDMEMDTPNLLLTDSAIGITEEIANKVIAMLS